ncbi:MAG: glycosyltransferase family 2 protein [Tissierellia bacterium]|nr:glycosyltransferase family 2 protein [Tissierellia bacterium]
MNKVSIITPCYNSSLYIHRLLDSVLHQTYSNIEMFVVNDGSTDNSQEIINSYISKFEKKGYTLKCINQTNQGQGSAVNNGLKYITGEYLLWPDSDDFYATSDAIERMVNVLDLNEDYAMVRTYAYVLDEDSLFIKDEFGGKKYINKKHYLFEDCLFMQNNFWFGAGMYMLRTSILFQNYPERNYYVSNQYGGQNWQLLLPVLYKNKCFTIEKHLFNVLSRANSHSRGTFKSIKKQIKKNEEHRNILLNTLDRIKIMQDADKHKYKQLIYIKYEKILINLILKYNKKEALERLNLFRKEYKIRFSLKELLIFCYYLVAPK